MAVALVRGNTGKNEWRKFAVFYISAICYSQEISKAGIDMTAAKTGRMTGHMYDEVVSIKEKLMSTTVRWDC